MNRIDRLLGILTLLQSRKLVAPSLITERFGISERTVYRDLAALQEIGIPIGCEPNKGYFIVQGYFLAPVSLTMDEANALLLMEPLSRGFGDKSIQKHYSNALGKIKAVLKLSQKESVNELTESIRVQLPKDISNDFEFLSKIQNSIQNKTIVTVQYKNASEEETRRRIEPIGLIFYALSWHMVAWCHLRRDYRDFRVNRIIGLTETGDPFAKEHHMELKDYLPLLPVNY